MTHASGEPFLIFADDVAWWDEPPEPTPPPAPPRRPRPHRQTRTLAGDLSRLRDAVAGSDARALALLAAVAAVVALVAGARVLLTGDEAGRQTPSAPQQPGAARPPVPQPVPLRTLAPGDRGAAVRDLQAALAALGHYGSAPDASFGDGTAAAVTAFQGERGLVVDGVAGPTTMRSLLDAIVERAAVDAAVVEEGLAQAVAAGRLPRGTASRHGEALAKAVNGLAALRPGRSATVGAVLHDIAAHADALDEPRALALFSMLSTNAEYLAKKPLPEGGLDIEDADGVVYRYFAGHGFQFHPLANFASLNVLLRKEQNEAARRLADALVARGVPSGRAVTWEYYFPFQGPPRWTSGLAQAAGAQALARSGARLGDAELLEQARGAYRAIRATLLRRLADGLWIREYGFADTAILNAQLQSIVSLSEYVDVTGDEGAAAVVAGMTAAARTLLARFDTGCWSRYSLDGAAASTAYHTYHVSLLRQLARRSGDALWSETAARWNGYLRAGTCTTT